MAIGAIRITAGCGSAPGTLCGGITVAQRMIASLQKAGAGWQTGDPAASDPGNPVGTGCLQPDADLLLHRLETAEQRGRFPGISVDPPEQRWSLRLRKPSDRKGKRSPDRQ